MQALPFTIENWINSPKDYALDLLSPKIKIIHFFQMLCPGCVYKGIPQTIEIFHHFHKRDVEVVAVHSVFEHHHVMGQDALEVFTKEWRLPFPIGIDKLIKDNWMPETMKAYQLQGTPSLLIIDHLGEIQLLKFGHLDQTKLIEIIEDLIQSKNKDETKYKKETK